MTDHRAPVVLARYPTEFEAALVRGILLNAGIPCEIAGIHTAGFRAEAPGMVDVLVPANREAEARSVLDAGDSQDDQEFIGEDETE